MKILSQQQHDPNGPTVTLPDNSTITANKKGILPLSSSLTPKASTAHLLQDLQSASLILVGQLCDNDCRVQFSKQDMKVYKNNKLIITGKRNRLDGIWDILITKNDSILRQQLNVILIKNKTKQQLAAYLHACCFSPSVTTFVKAIKKGHFITWPGLDATMIQKHLIVPVATAKGHLDQERKNLQSTQQVEATTTTNPTTDPTVDIDEDFFPTSDMPNTRTHDVLALIQPFKETRRAYSDQTGKFPHKSSRGNQYIMIVYDYDSNAILAAPLKNKAAATIRDAWEKYI